MPLTRLVIHGAAGRMGRSLLRGLAAREEFELVAALVRPGSALDGEALGNGLGSVHGAHEYKSSLEPEVHGEVLIDFSVPAAMPSALALARARGLAFVSGTTGLSGELTSSLQAAAQEIPVLWSANFSIGVALLKRLAVEAVRVMGADFDIEIIETHHRNKADAPSGTALALGRALAQARKLDFDRVSCFGRDGLVGRRSRDEIGISAVRGGDVVGDHTVLLAGDGERLELTHRAGTREVFVAGALRAATWIRTQRPGLYELGDVLG